MKKVTAEQIIENINVRIELLNRQGLGHPNIVVSQLQELLTTICKQSSGLELISDNTDMTKKSIDFMKSLEV